MALSTTEILGRIVGPVNLANGTSTVFTGTASHRYTIKKMTILNPTAGSITVKLGIGGVTDALLILSATALAAGESTVFNGMENLTGAETLQANTTATGCTFTANGLDQL